MLFRVGDICNHFRSKSREWQGQHFPNRRKWENIRLINYIEAGILYKDFSGFVWSINVSPGLSRREGKLVRSPTNHIPYTISARVQLGPGFWKQTIFVMQSFHSLHRGSSDNCSCVEDLWVVPCQITRHANERRFWPTFDTTARFGPRNFASGWKYILYMGCPKA